MNVTKWMLASTLLGLLLPAMGRATTLSFDSNAAGWQSAASSAPNSGPVSDASSFIAATAFTFVVSGVTADQPATDLQFAGQTVCYGGFFSPLCSSSYYRGPISFEEASTERFYIELSRSILGALFGPNGNWSFDMILRDAAFNEVGFGSQMTTNPTFGGPVIRAQNGLPTPPTAFGLLSDVPFSFIDMRQNTDSEFTTPFYLPDFAAPLAAPEPGTVGMLGMALLVSGVVRRRMRRHSSPTAFDPSSPA